MLLPIFENRFKKDIKRLQKRGKDMTKLKNVIDKLLQKQELEPKYKDHALMGNWNGYRDCRNRDSKPLYFFRQTQSARRARSPDNGRFNLFLWFLFR